jgi:hypothetical protein
MPVLPPLVVNLECLIIQYRRLEADKLAAALGDTGWLANARPIPAAELWIVIPFDDADRNPKRKRGTKPLTSLTLRVMMIGPEKLLTLQNGITTAFWCELKNGC